MSALTLLILLFSTFVHACTARGLSSIVQETGKQAHLFTKDVDKAELHKSPTQVGQENSVVKDFQIQQVGNNERKINANRYGEISMKREEASKTATSGNAIVPSPNVPQQLPKPQGQKNSQGRSMLGSSTYDTDEDVDTKENDVVEEIVVMDYAQPHRKPPIHNEKP